MSDAWTAYWSGGARDGRSGCVPNAGGPLHDAQARFWRDVAAALPPRARVLDLATGDGAVPRMLGVARADLRMVGVDAATALPPAPPRTELRPGVRMEALPFAPASFGGVTSQFGVEYGDVAGAAREIARVLRPDGRFALLCHHADGPLVAHNRGRAEALDWAWRGSGVPEKAAALARARALADLPTPPSFAQAVGEARRRFPGQAVAAEFLEAVRLTLDGGRRAPPAHALESMGELARRAQSELSRIQAMLAAALDGNGAAALAATLGGAGLIVSPLRTVALAGEARPFAWALTGTRDA